ncbi:PHP domain protein [Gemmatirosa kalamazoonensis]|uniref:PHP domain protein n=1 Tax=Gemmatirosa kalamazoonensis TaxID=861299 RepID=W0RJ54_9BACT|nr:PHP domain-containing protein [Gemmatirosa kalamazoonensis]AHG91129.1 PHP domain protein [Gemmatirosa kalamazoonensis]
MSDGQHVDLHLHSTASDGALAPEAVVDAARAAGLAAIALTDHDTVGGVDAAIRAGQSLGVRVIAGVELSAHDGAMEVHLLGLHIARVDLMASALARFRDDRVTRAEQIVAKLNAIGVPLTVDAVLAESGGGAVGRPHVARALVKGGFVADEREAFYRYLATGKKAYVDKPRLEVADAVRLVHEAGGIVVWAHPGSEGRRERVERFVAAGIDGLEVRHPSHNADDIDRLTALADFFRLVPSGGSDWHGQPGARAIGMMNVPAEWLAVQERRAESRRAA